MSRRDVRDPEVRDEMFEFAVARLKEEGSYARQAALRALLEETIRPFTSADGEQGRVARHALTLFVAQWSTHAKYSDDWRPDRRRPRRSPSRT